MERKRVVYLDNLKLLLTFLVVAHHASQAYTLGGSWIVKDSQTAEGLSNFLCVNMTFFMGAFFFISGYFVPQSLKNRSTFTYIGSKAKRLLLPVLALLFVIAPIYFYIVYWNVTTAPVSIFHYYIEIYIKQGLISYEHGWFLVSLFLYSMLYLLIHRACEKVKGALTAGKVVIFIVLMSMLSALIRLAYPIDTWVDLFGVIGIEPAHLPQYLLWFVAGSMAYENKWLDEISKRMGRTCIGVALATSLLIYCQDLLPHVIIETAFEYFYVYESIMSVTIVVSLLYLFKKFANKQTKIIGCMAENAFHIYVVHNLYVVLYQVVFLRISMNGYGKFAIVSVLAFTCSFLTAFIYGRLLWIIKRK